MLYQIARLLRLSAVNVLYSIAYVAGRTYRIGVGSAQVRLTMVQMQDADGVYREVRSCEHCVEQSRLHQALVVHVNELTERFNEQVEYGPEGKPEAPETVGELLAVAKPDGRRPNARDPYAGLRAGQPVRRV